MHSYALPLWAASNALQGLQGFKGFAYISSAVQRCAYILGIVHTCRHMLDELPGIVSVGSGIDRPRWAVQELQMTSMGTIGTSSLCFCLPDAELSLTVARCLIGHTFVP